MVPPSGSIEDEELETSFPFCVLRNRSTDSTHAKLSFVRSVTMALARNRAR
jgi:hypothetical protein